MNNNKWLQTFLPPLFLLIPLACIERKDQDSAKPSQNSALPTSSLHSLGLGLVNPNNIEANVKINGLGSSDYGGRFAVPELTIQSSNNAFMQILRCQSQYLPLLQNEVAEVATGSPADRQSAWQNAWGNNKFCTIASRHHTGPRFQDIAIPAGSFFYVINPCVVAADTVDGQKGCSYRLGISETVEQKHGAEQEVVQKNIELAEAEGRYHAVLSELIGWSRSLVRAQENCDAYRTTKFQDDEGVKLGANIGMLVGGTVTTLAIGSYAMKAGAKDGAKAGRWKGPAVAAAAIFGTAALLSEVLLSKHGGGKSGCAEAGKIAAKITEIQDSGALDQAQADIIRLSQELVALDGEFRALSAGDFRE